MPPKSMPTTRGKNSGRPPQASGGGRRRVAGAQRGRRGGGGGVAGAATRGAGRGGGGVAATRGAGRGGAIPSLMGMGARGGGTGTSTRGGTVRGMGARGGGGGVIPSLMGICARGGGRGGGNPASSSNRGGHHNGGERSNGHRGVGGERSNGHRGVGCDRSNGRRGGERNGHNSNDIHRQQQPQLPQHRKFAVPFTHLLVGIGNGVRKGDLSKMGALLMHHLNEHYAQQRQLLGDKSADHRMWLTAAESCLTFDTTATALFGLAGHSNTLTADCSNVAKTPYPPRLIVLVSDVANGLASIVPSHPISITARASLADSPSSPFSVGRNDFLLHLGASQMADIVQTGETHKRNRKMDELVRNQYLRMKIVDRSFAPSADRAIEKSKRVRPMDSKQLKQLVEMMSGSNGGWLQLLQELNDANFAVLLRRLADTRDWSPTDLSDVAHCVCLIGKLLENVHSDNSAIVLSVMGHVMRVGLLSRIAAVYLSKIEREITTRTKAAQHRSFTLNYGRMLNFVMTTMLSEYQSIKLSIDALVQLLLRSATSPHFHTHELEQLRQQLQTEHANAKASLVCQDNERRDVAAKEKEAKRRLLAQFPFDSQAPPDHFRKVVICPTAEEITSGQPAFVRRHIIDGAFTSTDEYLDIQFRLLREDMVEPLRNGIKQFKLAGTNSRDRRERLMQIYHDVRVEQPRLHMKCGTIVRRLTFPMRRQRLDKNMIYGSMVCLSCDGFVANLYFATIEDSNDIERGVIFIAMLHGEEMDASQKYDMVLSPAYYEAYKHVLRGLQMAPANKPIPFNNYLVHCKSSAMRRPQYLCARPSLDFGAVLPLDALGKQRKRMVNNVFSAASWPTKEQLGVDKSQYDAMRHALTNELAIIQGPPGTGKTFIGYQLVKILLDNEAAYNPDGQHPILVVCYTNHALDQFLEGLSSFVDAKMKQRPSGVDRCSILRVGGRCASEKLEPYMLHAHVKTHQKSMQTRRQLAQIYGESDDLRDEMQTRTKQMTASHRQIVRLNDILRFDDIIPLNIRRQLSDEDTFMSWMMAADLPPKVPRHNLPLIHTVVVINAFNLYNFLTEQPWAWLLSAQQREIYAVAAANAVGWRSEADGLQQAGVAWLIDIQLLPALEWSYTNEVPLAPPPVGSSQMPKWPRLRDVDHLCKMIQLGVDVVLALLHTAGNDLQLALQLAHKPPSTPPPMTPNQPFAYNPFDRASGKTEKRRKKKKENDAKATETAVDYYDEAAAECANRQVVIDDAKLREAVGAGRARGVEEESSDDEDDDGFTKVQDKSTKMKLLTVIAKLVIETPSMPLANVADVTNIFLLSFVGRWALYRHWMDRLRAALLLDIVALEYKYAEVRVRLKQMTQVVHMEVMRKSMVIGMTTTGAAKNRAILQSIEPRIVIMEEAAEVLEAHVVTSLNMGCQHLILIGDHQQLRPNPAVYELALKYNLDISLFERLVKNKFPSQQLHQQHRMRSKIRQIFMPHFYTKLTDHPNTHERDPIRGVDADVAFIDHRMAENNDRDTTSHSNEHETKWAIALCKYFLQQGYPGEKITVLIAYGEQMTLMRKRMELLVRHCKDADQILLRVLDSYQGEENDIVILSLVRSNKENNIGFLKTPNRICVALSRARDGLYIIGDMQCLVAGQGDKCDNMWTEMKRRLVSHDALLTSLPIRCPNSTHAHSRQLIGHPDEFALKSPEGGCSEMCCVRLECGHTCPERCHAFDPKHELAVCTQPCVKTCANEEYGHKCRQLCYKECGVCRVQENKLLPCGHQQKTPCDTLVADVKCGSLCARKPLSCGHPCALRCFEQCAQSKCCVKVMRDLPCGHSIKAACKLAIPMIKCTAKVTKKWPGCQHEVETSCSTDVSTTPCPRPCAVELPCKDKCTGTCGKCRNGRLHIKCPAKCSRSLICGHVCKSDCCKACPPCEEVCRTKCKHAAEKENRQMWSGGKKGESTPPKARRCGQACPPCSQKCTWSCRHHSCSKLCHEPCDRRACNEPCRRVLPCGPPLRVKGELKENEGESKENAEQLKEDEGELKAVVIHYCVGVCGEKCPTIEVEVEGMDKKMRKKRVDLCAVCHPEQMASLRETFFGTEDEQDAKFIQLPECGHILEMEGFDGYIESKGTPDDDQPSCSVALEIVMYDCPKCKTLIRTCDRFGARLKQNQMDIEAVKRAIRGTSMADVHKTHTALVAELVIFEQKEMLEKRAPPVLRQLERGMRNLRLRGGKHAAHQRSKPDPADLIDRLNATGEFVKQLFDTLANEVKKANMATLTKSKLIMYETIFRFLRTIAECHKEIRAMRGEASANDVSPPNRILKLLTEMIPMRVGAIASTFFMRSLALVELSALRDCVEHHASDMPRTMIGQVHRELQRACLFIKFCQLLDKHIGSGKDIPDSQVVHVTEILLALFDDKEFTQGKQKLLMGRLKSVALAAKSNVTLTKLPMREMTQTIGLPSGHWYKCACGAMYTSGDCCRPETMGKCIECKKAVGVSGHVFAGV